MLGEYFAIAAWNVINRVFDDESFHAAARAFAGDLADGPTLAHAATKQVIRDYLEGGLELANDRVAAVANDLGLLAEEFDAGEGRQTGNFPQALTHIALINTAHNLCVARQATEKPAMQRSK